MGCAHRRLPCQQCGAIVCLGMLQEHLEGDCPEHAVSCPFSVHGCPEVVKRRLMAEHLQQATGSHLALISSALVLRDMEIEMLKMELSRTREHFERRLSRVEGQCRGCASPSPSGPSAIDNAFNVTLPDVQQPLQQDPPRLGMAQPLPGLIRSHAQWEPRPASHGGSPVAHPGLLQGRPRPGMLQSTAPLGEQEGISERQQSQPVWAAPVHHVLQHRQPSFLTQNGVAGAPVFAPRGISSASAPRPHIWRNDNMHSMPGFLTPINFRDTRSPREEEVYPGEINGVANLGFDEDREQQSTQVASPGGGALTPFNPPVRSS